MTSFFFKLINHSCNFTLFNFNQILEYVFLAEESSASPLSPLNEDIGSKRHTPKFFTTKQQQETDRLLKLQEELMSVQLKYQKEIEKLEKENKELKRQLMLKMSESNTKRKVKMSLIDMYSDVLDELSDYDLTYCVQDHLPKVRVGNKMKVC